MIAVFLNDFAFSGKPLNKNCRKRSDPANYRPVSVIPAVAKVFERIIYDQVYQYLTKNSFVTSHDIGFSFLAFHTLRYFLRLLIVGPLTVIVALLTPSSKSFNTVEHDILLRK